MLDYKIIANKNVETIHGYKMYDLLSGSFNKHKPGLGNILIVNKYYVARPDLISLAVYGDDKYGDIICKVNGISNPFELNEDDILFIPDIDFIINCTKHITGEHSEIIQNEDEDEIVNNITSFQKKSNESRTSNQQIVGDKNFVIDKSLGLVFY